MASLIDNFDLDAMLPKDAIVTVDSNGSATKRIRIPDGVVQVTMQTYTRMQPSYYANGGFYQYTPLGKFTGEIGNWRITFTVAAKDGVTEVYPYWGKGIGANDVGLPCTIIFQRLGGVAA